MSDPEYTTEQVNKLMNDARADERAKLREAVGALTLAAKNACLWMDPDDLPERKKVMNVLGDAADKVAAIFGKEE